MIFSGMNLTEEVQNLETKCNDSGCDPVIIFDFNFDVEYEKQDNGKSIRWSTISMALDLTTSPEIEINSIQVWSLSYRNLKEIESKILSVRHFFYQSEKCFYSI